jgi:hypothetical protein
MVLNEKDKLWKESRFYFEAKKSPFSNVVKILTSSFTRFNSI